MLWLEGWPYHSRRRYIYLQFFDEASLQKIADSIASRIWSGFITFGSATAGVFGVLITIRLIKLTIDIAIHGYALHSAYGCSLYILGAIWSSLTNLLLYIAKESPQKGDPKDPSSTRPLTSRLRRQRETISWSLI